MVLSLSSSSHTSYLFIMLHYKLSNLILFGRFVINKPQIWCITKYKFTSTIPGIVSPLPVHCAIGVSVCVTKCTQSMSAYICNPLLNIGNYIALLYMDMTAYPCIDSDAVDKEATGVLCILLVWFGALMHITQWYFEFATSCGRKWIKYVVLSYSIIPRYDL